MLLARVICRLFRVAIFLTIIYQRFTTTCVKVTFDPGLEIDKLGSLQLFTIADPDQRLSVIILLHRQMAIYLQLLVTC